MSRNDSEFWKLKLMAFLHDSPDKCFDIGGHESVAAEFQRGAGFTDEEERQKIMNSIKAADHFASAAERFVFPQKKCATKFNGRSGSCFVHPFSSDELVAERELPETSGLLHEVLKSAVSGIEAEDWLVKYFLYWRRWLDNSVSSKKIGTKNIAFLPADTRIPDHSIWNHMAVTTAFAGCCEQGVVKPALLMFQLGPVQDFIAQARSTRDLWSGSYLLSWLMAHAMKAVSDQLGPDSIIFPNLRGNGIFDALHKEDMYSARWNDGNGETSTTWERILSAKQMEGGFAEWLLTPTLPNRFLALVPESQSVRIAEVAERAIHTELSSVGEAVWAWVAKEAGGRSAGWKSRWDAQIKAFPQCSWAVQPWLKREEILELLKEVPIGKDDTNSAYQCLKDFLEMAEIDLPESDRDKRYYTNGDVTKKLNNSGVLWSAHYAVVDAKLAARRNTRDFKAWNNPTPESAVKDSLSGKEECIGDEKFWKELNKRHKNHFVASHHYGAMNLIKRVWCNLEWVPYLGEKLGLWDKDVKKALRFESVQDIAKENVSHNKKDRNSYVAVLAMDGDKMGSWLSGAKLPKFIDQLSENARAYLRPILEQHRKEDLHRLLTPSFHLQLSEALANMATYKAREVVQKHHGQLIYAGGDDVLAMLPATRAIACAQELRDSFREPTDRHMIFPGPKMDVSVGVAIGHQNAPLQMLVRQAQVAEKTAKNDYDRGALAISLYKRSGEIIEWGCKWDDDESRIALKLMRKITELSSGEDAHLSGRFPYALAALLQPYKLEKSMPEMMGVIRHEVRHVLSRQAHDLSKEDSIELLDLIERYLEQTKDRLQDFIGLFLAETFINRNRGEG